MSYDSNNIFAKILRNELPSVRVYEDDHSVAFMDIMPQAEGHLLVVPREPAESLLDLSPQGAAAAIATVQKLARAVRVALDVPGVQVVQMNGPEAGQTVFHCHFHVIPRRADAPLRAHAGGAEDPEKLRVLAERIRAVLAAHD